MLEFASLCCGPQARGVAVAYGKVYVAQVDGHVVALDAKTGKVIWKTRREDILPQPYHWYTFTGAPQVYNGLVVVGNGGAEWPTRGFVEALDAETGKLVWRFYDTAGPDDPNFKGAWEGDSWKIGGGSMWDAVAVDPKRDLMMFAIGNPNPDLYGDFRKGNNLYTVSMVAVHAKTGKLAWYYQQIPHDVWDLDSAAPTMLFDVLDKNGKTVAAAAEANKNGHLYIVNRDTGKLIRRSRCVRSAERIDHEDDPTGRDGAGLLPGQSWRRDVAAAGLFAASPIISTPWRSTSPISTRSRPASPGCRERPEVGQQFGSAVPTEAERKALAIPDDSAVRQPVGHRRQHRQDRLAVSQRSPDVRRRAGHRQQPRVFAGEVNGNIMAFDAKSGEKLWSYHLGIGVCTPPITYRVKGVQYLAVGRQRLPQPGDADESARGVPSSATLLRYLPFRVRFKHQGKVSTNIRDGRTHIKGEYIMHFEHECRQREAPPGAVQQHGRPGDDDRGVLPWRSKPAEQRGIGYRFIVSYQSLRL